VLVEVLHHSRVGELVVALERQQVVSTACQDLLGNRGLAPHGVERHDAVLQRELIQQFRHGGDCTRRRQNPSLKWPVGPVAPE